MPLKFKFKRIRTQTPVLEFNVGKHGASFTGVPALVASGVLGLAVGKTLVAITRR